MVSQIPVELQSDIPQILAVSLYPGCFASGLSGKLCREKGCDGEGTELYCGGFTLVVLEQPGGDGMVEGQAVR
jgi:hypothetical protein